MITMIHSPRVEITPCGSTTSNLLCPRCGGAHLHQSRADVFDRQEDDDQVFHTTVMAAGAQSRMADSRDSGNPSARRDGLTVRFWCEGCGGDNEGEIIELVIAQHKGNTEIGWRFTPMQTRQDD